MGRSTTRTGASQTQKPSQTQRTRGRRAPVEEVPEEEEEEDEEGEEPVDGMDVDGAESVNSGHIMSSTLLIPYRR